MLQEKKERIEELFQQDTDALVKEISETNSPEEFIAAFANRGVELTEEDVQEIMNSVPQASGELDDDQLESISGGVIIPRFWNGGAAKAIQDAINAIRRKNRPRWNISRVAEEVLKSENNYVKF